ncbi:hypothetical protein Tco_0037945 [Tanacetum coccineum]
MFGTIPPIPPPQGTNSGNAGSPNKVDTMPTTNDTINTTTTTNVAQNVIDENLPQLLDSRGGSHGINAVIKCKTAKAMWNDLILAHEGLSGTRDTKIAAMKLKFNAFKELEGEKASSLKALISNNQFQDSDTDVEEDLKSSSEFIIDLNVKYHERALLSNQKRLYKRSGRDEESVSSEDKGTTKVKAFMTIAEEESSVGKADARSGQWVKITMKKVRIMQKSQENGQNRTITDTGTELSVQRAKRMLSKVNNG